MSRGARAHARAYVRGRAYPCGSACIGTGRGSRAARVNIPPPICIYPHCDTALNTRYHRVRTYPPHQHILASPSCRAHDVSLNRGHHNTQTPNRVAPERTSHTSMRLLDPFVPRPSGDLILRPPYRNANRQHAHAQVGRATLAT